MAQGDQTKSLITISKNKGWDPTQIIGTVDKIPVVGELGDRNVSPMLPTDYSDGADTSIGSPSVTWNAPDSTYEHQSRASSGANPFPAMPGAKG